MVSVFESLTVVMTGTLSAAAALAGRASALGGAGASSRMGCAPLWHARVATDPRSIVVRATVNLFKWLLTFGNLFRRLLIVRCHCGSDSRRTEETRCAVNRGQINSMHYTTRLQRSSTCHST